MFLNMKFTYFSLLSLTSLSLALAQLDRMMVINQQSTDIVTVPTEPEPRTMRQYRTQGNIKMKRRTTTVPHVVDKTCLLIPDPGPCRGRIGMWFFDPKAGNCSSFYWGGCQGNGNRFDKLEQCFSTCLSAPGWKESRPRYCSLTFDYGWCFGADERYYYDRSWGVCKKTIYSGCGGNKNNFYSKEKCEDICLFGSFSLHQRKTKDDNLVKKILIVNPYQITDPTKPPAPTTPSTKKRTGNWWLEQFQKKFPNKKFLDINKESPPPEPTRPAPTKPEPTKPEPTKPDPTK